MICIHCECRYIYIYVYNNVKLYVYPDNRRKYKLLVSLFINIVSLELLCTDFTLHFSGSKNNSGNS